MKKGFTMIELIFVIVILGILSAVAIPRLAATRDDAEVSKAATNITTLISDISSYYTSQGEFTDLGSMTNVQLSNLTGSLAPTTGGAAGTPGAATLAGLQGDLTAAGNPCLKVGLTTYNPATKQPATLTIVEAGAGNSICDKIHNNAGVKKLTEGYYTFNALKSAATATKAAVYEDQNSSKGQIAISGIGVKF